MKRLFVLISLLFLIVMLVRFIRGFQYAMHTLSISVQESPLDFLGLNGNTASTLRSTGYETS